MKTLMALVIIFIGTALTYAQQTPALSPSTTTAAIHPADSGNKLCPVSGRTVGLMGPGVDVIYNGKIYHLCCGGCIKNFESDPEKYLKILEVQTAQNRAMTQ